MRRTTLILSYLLFPLVATAQTADSMTVRPAEPYTVEASLSTGPAISFFRDRRTPVSPGGGAVGASTMLRLMWHPGRMISFGLSTGYTLFSREDFTYLRGLLRDTVVPGRATLYGFPLQLAVGMQKFGLDVGMAMGPYLMVVDLVDEYGHARASRLELAITAFASYEWPIGRGFHAGPSVRAVYLSYRGIFTIIPEYRIRYDLFSY